MIRCPVTACVMITPATCEARLAWLVDYESTGKPLNPVINDSVKEKYREYLLCRKCKIMEVEGG